jgi:hypothetical protein
MIWGLPVGTVKASALFNCLKSSPDVIRQMWRNLWALSCVNGK